MRIQRGKLPGVKPTIFKLREGGTGSSTPDGALTALDAVPASLIDKPGGVLSLDSSGKLKPDVIAGLSISGVSIDGPTSMSINQSLPFTITDYDSFLTYNIAAIGGSVSRSGDTITYTAPSSAGPSGFTINGKTISVAVGANIVMAPTINNIINGATNINSTINLTTTAFTVSSGFDTHQWTDWQIATDAAFTAIVTQSLSDTVNKTSWTSGSLQPNTTYYARVRYKGNAYGYSNWSSVLNFTTKTSFAPSVNIARLVDSPGVNGQLFGFSVALTDDGTRLVIGVRQASQPSYNNVGGVYVYVKSGVSWILEQKIYPTPLTVNSFFGQSVDINGSGERLVVGSFKNSSTGSVYVFTRSGSVWSQESELQPSISNSSMRFGCSVSIDVGGNRIAVGASLGSSVGSITGGAVYIFLRSGTSWTQEAKIIASDYAAGWNFGFDVSINDDGSRVIVGSNSRIVRGIPNVGSAYIFLRSGTSWAQEAILEPSSEDDNLTAYMGASVDIDSSGTRVVVGSPLYNESRGAITIFLRSGTSWTQEVFLNNSININNITYVAGQYGHDVSINGLGDIVVASIPYYGGAGVRYGAIFVHTRSGVSWDTKDIIKRRESVTIEDRFGFSIDISSNGGVVSVGAPYVDYSGITNGGAVYLFV